MAELVVLGLDPGSRSTGFGIVAEIAGRAFLLEAGTILTRDKDMAARLGRIFSKIAAVIECYNPTEAAVENIFVAKNTASAIKLGQARGAALAACGIAGITVAGYEPSKVKKSLVGIGSADKKQVAFMVASVLAVKNPGWTLDASDALAVAICHLHTRFFCKIAGLV